MKIVDVTRRNQTAAALKSVGNIIALLALFAVGFAVGRMSIGWQISAMFGF